MKTFYILGMILIVLGLFFRSSYLHRSLNSDRHIESQILNLEWPSVQVGLREAKSLVREEREITVAVIDTGLDTTHPALRHSVWKNSGEMGKDFLGRDKSSNGLDDDGNGFIDDLHGWDFVERKPLFKDLHGHGTHIAGIISSHSSRIRILPIRYYSSKTNGKTAIRNTIQSIDYAIQMKVDIINYSSGGYGYSSEEYRAVKRARDAGILFVAAAGNDSLNSNLQKYYPAGYDLSNIISVTALDKSKRVLKSSNYGSRSVDIAAPGEAIFSTLPRGKFGKMTGTSQATAFVSGAAALILSQEKERVSPVLVKNQIIEAATIEGSLELKTRSRARLSVSRALKMKGVFESLSQNETQVVREVFVSGPALATSQSSQSFSSLEQVARMLEEIRHY